MAGFINHHSFLIFGGLLLLIGAGVLLVRRARRAWIIWGVVLLLLGGVWFLLGTRQAQPPDTLAEIEAVLASGQPVLVEIYSNY